MEEKKLKPNQEKAKKLLHKLKDFFSKKERKILRIRVIAGTNKFWCSNPKKIKYYKSLAEQNALFSMKNNSVCIIRITKVIYKWNRRFQ